MDSSAALRPQGLCTGSSLRHRVSSQSADTLRLTSFPLNQYRHPHSFKILSVPMKAALVSLKASSNHQTSSYHRGSFASSRHSFDFRMTLSESAGLCPPPPAMAHSAPPLYSLPFPPLLPSPSSTYSSGTSLLMLSSKCHFFRVTRYT